MERDADAARRIEERIAAAGQRRTLEEDLASVINRHSVENESDTPDFVLAEFLMGCLRAFNRGTQERERFYSRPCGSGKALGVIINDNPGYNEEQHADPPTA